MDSVAYYPAVSYWHSRDPRLKLLVVIVGATLALTENTLGGQLVPFSFSSSSLFHRRAAARAGLADIQILSLAFAHHLSSQSVDGKPGCGHPLLITAAQSLIDEFMVVRGDRESNLD